MVDVSAKVSDRDVVAAGSVVLSSGDESAEFEFSGLRLKVIFDPVQVVDVAAELQDDDKILIIRFRSVSSVIGVFYSAEIGRLDNRQLHVAFNISAATAERPSRLLNYTFSLGRVIDGQ